MTPFPASARKSHSPGREAAAERGGACGDAAVEVGVAAAVGTGEGGSAVGVDAGDGRGRDVCVSRGGGEPVAVGEGTGAAGCGSGVKVAGADVGVGLGLRVAVAGGVGGRAAGACLAMAVGVGATGVEVGGMGRGVGATDVELGRAGLGVGVAAGVAFSSVGVARRATTTLGPQEMDNGKRTATVARARYFLISTLGTQSYLSEGCNSDSRRRPAGTFCRSVFVPEGQRTVTWSARTWSPRPK